MPLILSSLCLFAAVWMITDSLGAVWDQITDRYLSDIKLGLRRLDMDDKQLHLWMRWWGISLVGSLVLFVVILQMAPLAVFVVFLIFVAPRYIMDWLLTRRRVLIRDQLVRVTVGIANGCRSGMALPQAIEKLAFDAKPPISKELQRIVRDYRAGRPLQEAIRDVQLRLDVEAFTTFASAVIVTLQKGGNISASLDRISQGLQETQRLERKLEADAAAGKRMAFILSMFPIGFLGMFYLLDPVSMNVLFGTLLGQLVILTVLVIVYVSWLWCLRILNLNF